MKYADRTVLSRALLGLTGDVAGAIGRIRSRQAATELNKAEAQMTTLYGEFWRGLRDDPEPDTYLDKLASFQESAYGTLRNGLTSPEAIRAFDMGWTSQKAAAEQKTIAMADDRSRAVSFQGLLDSLDTVMRSAPSSVTSAAEFYQAQEHNITTLVGRAHAGGVIDAEMAAEMREKYTSATRYATARDYGIAAVRQLLGSGLPAGEAIGIMDQAIRLEGEEYDAFIAAQGSRLSDPMLQNIAEGYRTLELTPAEEEALVREMRSEAAVVSGEREDLRATVKRETDSAIVELWSTTNGIRELAANNFAWIKSHVVGADEQVSWINRIRSYLSALESEGAGGVDAAAYGERLQAYERAYDALEQAPEPEAIEAYRAQVLDDELLEKTDRRFYLNQVRSLEADLAAREATAAAEAQENAEKRAELAKEAERKRQEAEAERHHLAEWRNAKDRLDAGVLTKEDIDNYATFDEGDLTHWYGQLDAAKRRAESGGPAAGKPWETVEATEADVTRMYWNREVKDDAVGEYVMGLLGAGLSAQDVNTWMGRLDTRQRDLRDRVGSLAFDTVDNFFRYQYEQVESDELRAELARAQATASLMLGQYLQSDEYLAMDDLTRQAAVNEYTAQLLVNPIITRTIRRDIARDPQDALRDLIAGKAHQSILQGHVNVLAGTSNLRYLREGIGPAEGVEFELLDDQVVLHHIPSDTYFKLYNDKWQIGTRGRSGGISWQAWSERRIRDLKATYE